MSTYLASNVGYCVPWVVRPGGHVALHASLGRAASIDVVRVACANAEQDPTGAPYGPPERVVALTEAPNWRLAPATQALVPGVQIGASADSWPDFAHAMLVLAVQWNGHGRGGHILSLLDSQGHGYRVDLIAQATAGAQLSIAIAAGLDSPVSDPFIRLALPFGDWLLVTVDPAPGSSGAPGRRGTVRVRSARCRPCVPGGIPEQWTEDRASVEAPGTSRPTRLRIGTLDATQISADVRLDLVSLLPADAVPDLLPHDCACADDDSLAIAAWEAPLVRDGAPGCLLRGRIGSGTAIDDLTGAALVTSAQRPYTAERGLRWDGRFHSPSHAPTHYSALHLNSDTMLDALWEETVRWQVPDDLPGGTYAFRMTSDEPSGPAHRYGVFIVSDAGRPRHRIAMLIPSFSYLAYANATEAMRGPVVTHAPHPAEALLDAVHPAFGRSIYERHPDGHGVLYCSSRRPLLSVSPGHRPWQFVADTWLLDWLETCNAGVDIVTDHDLHRDGEAVLKPYAVVVTGHHPEYWSTPMWDGLWRYLNAGGRLMYLGGNGLYWRTAFDEAADMIEVRRAEDGTRPSIAPPGEYHCAFTGELGGLWRRLGRPPQQIVGVGMAAQGFERAGHFRKCADADEAAVGFVFAGVEGATFGHGGWLGGGASGWEIDRIDVDLGTPRSHWWLARSDGHAPSMLRTKEELLSYVPPFRDAKARSDIALVPIGRGDVFAVGSMTWVGSLHSPAPGQVTDVATITANVLRRFQDPRPVPRKPSPGE